MLTEEEVDLGSLCAEYAEAKRAENEAAARAKKLREQIVAAVPEDPNHETQELPGGVKMVYKNVSKFSDDIVEFLEELGYPEAVQKSVNTDRLSSLIEVGLIAPEEVAPYYVEKFQVSLTTGRGR